MASRWRQKWDPTGLPFRLRSYYIDEWTRAQEAYSAAPADFYASWQYLAAHPIVSTLEGRSLFTDALWVFIAKVDPETQTVEDDTSRNTKVQVWFEMGPVYLTDDSPEQLESREVFTHDGELDCSGDTYEEAIVTLAALVAARYGHDRYKVYRT